MGKRETLRQYLTYTRNIDDIEQVFIGLDSQLKYLHSRGFCVFELNSDSILLDKNYDDVPTFTFASVSRFSDRDRDVATNITDLSKLAIGAYISTENGFCDYSKLPTDYIKKYFNEISFYLPNASYFSRVIMDSDASTYYSDYIQMSQSASRSNSRQKSYTNAYGKMYAQEDDAAFIQLIFYPVVIISVITAIAVLSKILG